MSSQVQQDSTELEKARAILSLWWPLAASTLLIAIELPSISMVLSRLPDPKLSLACFGGIVYPLALLIESPVFMFTTASTALSKDFESFCTLKRYVNTVCALLTLLHALLIFTPLYGFVVEGLLGATPEVATLSRHGLMASLAWPWAVGYRRFIQGALIRRSHSKLVGKGTVLRLTTVSLMLLAGYAGNICSGLVLGPAALSVGVIVEAVYIHFCAVAWIYPQMRNETPAEPPLTFKNLNAFYLPLALTSVLSILVLPFGTAAMFRMPLPVDSLAAWPVVSSLVFLFRSVTISYTEVVVALVETAGMFAIVRKVGLLLGVAATLLLLLITVTPLSTYWFEVVTAMPKELLPIAKHGLWFGLPMPILTAIHSWLQGLLVTGRKTKAISQGMILLLGSMTVLLWVGVRWGQAPGLFVYQCMLCLAMTLQAAWNWAKSRETESALLAKV